MRKRGAITKSVANALYRPEKARVHSVEGNRVNVRVGSSPTLLRNVEVVGDAGFLAPETEVSLIWRQGRPVVLAGGENGAPTGWEAAIKAIWQALIEPLNAGFLQGFAVSTDTPAGGQSLLWDDETQSYKPGTIAGSGDMLMSVYDTNGDSIVDQAASAPWAGITGKPASYTPEAHTHDDRYYTETELSASGGGGAVHWDNVASKPAAYPPDTHVHDDRYYTKTNMASAGQAVVEWSNIINRPPISGGSGGIDVGSVLPAEPTKGQLFFHEPNGRRVLMFYDGSTWFPLQSYGDMTMYVDGTLGTDNPNKGGATGADAFATVQYAIDMIPGTISGNVVVNIASGTYEEDIVIANRKYTGNYSISINGTLSEMATITGSGGVQGTGATRATVTGSGFGSWRNKLLKCQTGTNADVWRVIDASTATTLTMIGTWPAAPANGDTYTVYTWDTGINSIKIDNTNNVNVASILFLGSIGRRSFEVTNVSKNINIYRCYIKTVEGSDNYCVHITSQSVVAIEFSAIDNVVTTATGFYAIMFCGNPGTVCRFMRSVAIGNGKTSANNGLVVDSGLLQMGGGSRVSACKNGILCQTHGWVSMAGWVEGATGGNTIVDNCTTGVSATAGGAIVGTGNNTYTSNTTNEAENASTFAYVD